MLRCVWLSKAPQPIRSQKLSGTPTTWDWTVSCRPAVVTSPGRDREHSEFAKRYLTFCAQSKTDFRPTAETFREFCRSTGLSSSALVGKGENLATLVFYLVVHGMLAANGVCSRRQMGDLLRATQKYRSQWGALLEEWLATVTANRSFQPRALHDAAPAAFCDNNLSGR